MGTNATPNPAVLVGRNIIAARERAGLTRTQLADALGVAYKDVWRWETGRVEPTAYRREIADTIFDGELAAMYAEVAA